jgi:transposase
MVAVQQQAPVSLHPDFFYAGIDIGKDNHYVAFYSTYLQQKCGHYTACPAFSFANARLDFEHLASEMERYAPLTQWRVLMEKTGHYYLPLLQYLQERGIETYLVHVKKRPRKQKNDKRDAQGLANTAYRQLELGAEPDDAEQEVHRVAPTCEAARALRELVQYHDDLSKQMVRILHQLTGICDLLFPEFSLTFKNVNLPTALVFREHYPTPRDVAAASLSDLRACRLPGSTRPGNAALNRLQGLAAHSIGIADQAQIGALILRQSLLIKQLHILETNDEEIKAAITAIVESSREGQIITSLGAFVGSLAAGQIIAAIGSIDNFEKPGKFKAYTGWMPIEDQSGKSRSGMVLSKGGNRMLRKTMWLIGMRAVNGKHDTEWLSMYEDLVERQCPYDAKKRRRTGKGRPLSRIIGQIATMIYRFLKDDAEIVANTPPGSLPPPVICYDRNVHRSHIHRRRR